MVYWRSGDAWALEPKPENLVQTQGTTTEYDEARLEAIRKGRTRPPASARITEAAPFNFSFERTLSG
jgi:hypothetical protein